MVIAECGDMLASRAAHVKGETCDIHGHKLMGSVFEVLKPPPCSVRVRCKSSWDNLVAMLARRKGYWLTVDTVDKCADVQAACR